MVRRVLSLVYKEVRGLHQAAYVLALFTFVAQVLALFRDRMLASTFGAGVELDLYYAAFKIPDLLFVLFASMLSVYVLIPFVQRRQTEEGDGSARAMLGQIFSVFLVGYALIAGILFFAVPYIAPVLFPGLAGEEDTLVQLIRILLLQPFLLGLSSLLGVVTQLSHRFVLYAVSPILYNVGIMIGILFFYPVLGLSGLVWGVVLGALMHMAIQIPFMRGNTLRFGLESVVDRHALSEVLIVSMPRALTLSLNQVTILMLISFASVLTVGSVSVFQFAFNLQSVPLAIIGVSYSVAAFPILSELFAKNDMSTFRYHIQSALRHIIFWSVPAIALIVVLRAQIVRVVLGSGSFDWADTRLTAAILALLSISLVAQAINLLLIRALYAGGHTRLPLTISVLGFFVAAAALAGGHYLSISSPSLQAFLESLFRIESVSGSEVLVVAAAYMVSVMVQTIFFLRAGMHVYELQLRDIFGHFMQAVVAAVLGGLVAYATLRFVVSGINEDTFMGILLQGVSAGVIGCITIALLYYLQKTPEFSEVLATLRRRVFKIDRSVDQTELI